MEEVGIPIKNIILLSVTDEKYNDDCLSGVCHYNKNNKCVKTPIYRCEPEKRKI